MPAKVDGAEVKGCSAWVRPAGCGPQSENAFLLRGRGRDRWVGVYPTATGFASRTARMEVVWRQARPGRLPHAKGMGDTSRFHRRRPSGGPPSGVLTTERRADHRATGPGWRRPLTGLTGPTPPSILAVLSADLVAVGSTRDVPGHAIPSQVPLTSAAG